MILCCDFRKRLRPTEKKHLLLAFWGRCSRRMYGKTDYFSTHGCRRSGFNCAAVVVVVFDDDEAIAVLLLAAARALLEKKLVEFAICVCMKRESEGVVCGLGFSSG